MIKYFIQIQILFNYTQSRYYSHFKSLQIQKCIQLQPNNSLLYSNRSLFYAQTRKIQKALDDLNTAIQLNNLNYIAYFNLSSMKIRQCQYKEALENLKCSISVLYLLKGKQTKSIQDLNTSLLYAGNNFQAKILKSLIEIQNGNFNSLEQNQSTNYSQNILALLSQIINQNNHQKQKVTIAQVFKLNNSSKRLESKQKFDENADFQKLIHDKIEQFNKVYRQISDVQGIKTQKIKVDNPQSNQTYLTQKTVPILIQNHLFNKKSSPFKVIDPIIKHSVNIQQVEQSQKNENTQIYNLHNLKLEIDLNEPIIIDSSTGQIINKSYQKN